MIPSLSKSPDQIKPKTPASLGQPHPLRLLIPLALIVVTVGAGLQYWRSRPEQGVLQVSGRLEGYETDVGAKVGGRIEFVAVREGDAVKTGEVIVRLEDDEIQAQLQAAEAGIKASQEQQIQAQIQIEVIRNQILEAQLSLQQSQGDAFGRISQAQSNVAAAEAQLAAAQAQVTQAEAEQKLARLNLDRYGQLLQEGAINQQQYDQVQTAEETAAAALLARQAAVTVAQKQVDAAQGLLVQAKTADLNPQIRQAQVDSLQRQLNQAQSSLIAAQAATDQAQAQKQQIAAQLAYLTVLSPIDGVVTARTVEPGVVVTAGKTLLTLLDLNTVYLRGFVPEGDIGKVRVGQAAHVFLDSAPDQPLSARVTAIDPQASFTPETIYFQDDRVRQVFGIKISIDQPGGFAKPGMPADAEILMPEPE
jgi:HlyD family secretion protein